MPIPRPARRSPWCFICHQYVERYQEHRLTLEHTGKVNETVRRMGRRDTADPKGKE